MRACSTTLWIYTILKLRVDCCGVLFVLLPYGFTLFSNEALRSIMLPLVLLPYGFTLFSNHFDNISEVTNVLLPYGFTLFSNIKIINLLLRYVLLPYGFTLFSNGDGTVQAKHLFYYLMDLHYSQTQEAIIY